MKFLSTTSLASSLLALTLGCSSPSENNGATNNGATSNNGTTNNGMTTNNGTADAGNNGAGDAGNNGLGDMDVVDMGPSSGWSLSAHPCVGNRTDALWCDDAQTCFVSCGTTTTGQGLFMTADGGATWEAPTTNPAGYFDTARVNSISRSDDGLLYLAGDLPNSAGVVSMDESGALAEVFTRGTTIDFSFTVGSFRRSADGFSIAESLTGVDLVVREMDGGDPQSSWSTGRGFWSDGDADDVPNGVQILDMEVHNNSFWAAGSTINQPPTVFTPKWTAGDFDFGIVPLAEGLGEFSGELWGIDVNDDGVSVGGVNQDRDVGMIYSLASAGGDPTVAASWTAFDVSTLFPDNATWVTDVCRGDGNVVYATGRESAEGWGFVLRSNDGGASFEDITPYDGNGNSTLPDVSRCQADAAGVLIAGQDGLFGRNF